MQFYSIRLTSWVLIALKDASQAEWEEYNLFIDPRVRAKSSKWILRYQTPEGSWKERSNILDREKFQVEIIYLFYLFIFKISKFSHFYVRMKQIYH
jgi:squalene cyclase